MCFVNFSNHASAKWGKEQYRQAKVWGEIVDVPFPHVNPEATKEEVILLARECVEQILQLKPSVVMCQGEFTLAYHVVSLLKQKKIPVVAACSRRVVKEICVDENTIQKNAVFVFTNFREY